MDRFKRYLASPLTQERPSPAELDALVARYAWFTPARIAREAASGQADPQLALTAPWRLPGSLRRTKIDATVLAVSSEEPEVSETSDFTEVPKTTEVSEAELIDRFLREENLRIVAQQGEADEEVVTSVRFDEEDEVVSEQLAEVYLAQGLHERAAAIYRKLSLLNPEKSVYFAELIRKTENNK